MLIVTVLLLTRAIFKKITIYMWNKIYVLIKHVKQMLIQIKGLK